MSFHPKDYLDSKATEHWKLFTDLHYVWEALPLIEKYFKDNLKSFVPEEFRAHPHISKNVYIGKGTKIAPTAIIEGPAWIGENCEIRPGAYIRANVIIGSGCILGNSCEFKNSVLFNNCQIPHFSYVGDSILGQGVHLGAGVICSNLKLHQDLITITHEGKKYETQLRKFGAILGDRAEVGCNAVLNPGSILGRQSLIYPGVQWRGVLPEKSIAKATISYHVSPRKDL